MFWLFCWFLFFNHVEKELTLEEDLSATKLGMLLLLRLNYCRCCMLCVCHTTPKQKQQKYTKHKINNNSENFKGARLLPGGLLLP